MISSRTRRKLRQGCVGPAISIGAGLTMTNNRKNSCKRGKNSRRYNTQAVLPKRPKLLTILVNGEPKQISWKAAGWGLRNKWRNSVKPIKIVHHDKWS